MKIIGIVNGKIGWTLNPGDKVKYNVIGKGDEIITVVSVDGKTLNFVDENGVSGRIILG